MRSFDVVIVGGGIVGLATAYRLMQRYPRTSLAVVEKETAVGAHQSSHNSGVLHTGIYYRPGSLRAQNCRAGKLAMEQFCREQGIPFDICGKVIVAVNDAERERLRNILDRGQANGVNCTLIDRDRLCEIEPSTAGVEAIHVPEAGIVDYGQVCRKLEELIRRADHEVLLGNEVRGIERRGEEIVIATPTETLRCRTLITCGGLWADRLIRMSGVVPRAPIVPFRGEFFELKPEARSLCRGLIYPVPDPSFPFLGVHFTKTIHGGVECGPNAVLAFARAGYTKTSLNLRDLSEALCYRGFQRLAWKNWRTGLGEVWRSWSKGAFVHALQRLVPEIRSEHLIPGHTGVRAQALGADGSLIDDFVIQKGDRMVHVGNAPSPAATASLNIGTLIVDQLHDFGHS